MIATSAPISVNLHCHTNFSDGEQTPEQLAEALAAAGVRCAALTDHDTLEGLPRFEEALKRFDIACIPGVELFTQMDGYEIHLLGYGFDPHNPELLSTLVSLRQASVVDVHSIAGSLRKAGVGRETQPALSAAPNGRLGVEDAINLIHRAGGFVFWAHPLISVGDLEQVERMTAALKARGLDGIEAVYASFNSFQQEQLRILAARYDLLVAAGTDCHGPPGANGQTYSISMPRADWVRFRTILFSGAAFAGTQESLRNFALPAVPGVSEFRPRPVRRRSYVLRIFIPTFTAILLFLAAFWGLILPSFEQTLLDRKREMIRELTNSAWSILVSYHRDETNGLLSREEAQRLAVTRIEALRYGDDGKDYFWIQDTYPRMIMHPYRTDLNGQDLTNFVDSRGVPIFVEFARQVERKGDGYIEYVWQWNDDPQRLVPKESYVKGFAPWGWIIGTGIYIDDVNREIARIERSLINTSLGISGVIVVLLLFVLQQSLHIERERQRVVDSLRESTERYHALAEATTEGALLVIDRRCRYANSTLLQILGYDAGRLDFLDLEDILPRSEENAAVWRHIEEHAEGINGNPAAAVPEEGYLARGDGSLVACLLTLNPIEYAGQRGMILLARNIALTGADFIGEEDSLAVKSAPVGYFRARAARRAVLTAMNDAARGLIPASGEKNAQPALADLFSDSSEFEALFAALMNGEEVKDHLIHLENNQGAARFLSLSAWAVKDENGRPGFIAGLLRDVTAARKLEIGRETIIDRLQATLLFFHEPLVRLGREALVCRMDTTIAQLAREMSARQVTAALVSSESGAVIGIVTDHDLRARVLAGELGLHAPIHTIMSAPLIRIPENALIYEALMRMEEHGVRHLAVEDASGQVVNVIDSKSLIQFQRYGPIVLTREIARSRGAVEVARSCERTSPLVKTLMDSSARPRHVTNMLASICDAATERLIQLALEELGPPPVPFAFVAMGSQGRQEQTLLTDQDNGILYAAPDEQDAGRVQQYFLQLGGLVCGGLNQAGYSFCRGGVMASNPRWCRSLPAWISGFDAWLRESQAQEIIDLSIFFDFRTVYGEAELAHRLRSHIHSVMKDQSAFFHHFAQNALMFKPPFRLLGNIYLSPGSSEHGGEINLKDAMMPFVAFARLYALRHQVNQTHTLARIEALVDRGVILPSTRDEIAVAYDFLMQIRLQAQLEAIQSSRPPLNSIHPARMGYIQKELLKQAFAQVAAVQKKVSYDFLGGM